MNLRSKLPPTAPLKCANCQGPHTVSYRGRVAFKPPASCQEKLTAVERIQAKRDVTYAQAAANNVAQRNETPANDEANTLQLILNSLRRLEEAQVKLESTVTELSTRVMNLEGVSKTPSPRRKIRRT